jgi:hypothetical protein
MLADVKASAHQALGIVSHLHAGKLECPDHLVASEQTQLDPLTVVLDTLRGAKQIMMQKN